MATTTLEYKNNLETGEYGNLLCDYTDGYIFDIITQIADSQVSIYYNDIDKFADEHEEWLNEAMLNGFVNMKSYDTFTELKRALSQTGEFMYIENDIYEHFDDSLLLFLVDYLEHEHSITELSDDIVGWLDNVECDYNKRLDDYTEELDEILKS